jgi:signal peptidase I
MSSGSAAAPVPAMPATPQRRGLAQEMGLRIADPRATRAPLRVARPAATLRPQPQPQPRLHRARTALVAVRVLAGLATGAVLGAAATLAVATILPGLAGGRAMTVMSGSMAPELGVGDVVLTRGIAAREARLGDVVTFRDPNNRKRLITHRVHVIRIADGHATFWTKGDANATGAERWTIPLEGRIGRVEYRIPKLGYAVRSAGGAPALLLLIPTALFGAFELVRIWRPRERS